MSLFSRYLKTFAVVKPLLLSPFENRPLVNSLLSAWRPWLLPRSQLSTFVSSSTSEVLKPAIRSTADCLGSQPVRTNVRVHYRPNAYRRLKKHGLKKRKSTVNGLKMLWRRKLKGRWFLHT